MYVIIHLCIYVFIYLFIHLYTYLFNYLIIYLCNYSFIYVFIYLFIYLFVYLSAPETQGSVRLFLNPSKLCIRCFTSCDIPPDARTNTRWWYQLAMWEK